jgi:hypothetical protein
MTLPIRFVGPRNVFFSGEAAPRTAHVLLLSLFLLSSPLPASGQRIEGRVLEAETHQPIPWAALTLLDITFTAVMGATADEAGRFAFEAPAPGAYYLLVEALGYQPGLDGILELGEGGSISVDFYLRPRPLELDSLRVAVARLRVNRGLSDSGFYDRMKMGGGTFITPEEIERRNPREVTEVFRAVPDLVVRREGVAGTRIMLPRPMAHGSRGGLWCNPRVYIDGVQVVNNPLTEARAAGFLLEEEISVSDIGAVEVHTRSTTIPLVYGGTQEGCGVIMIWTRFHTGGG